MPVYPGAFGLSGDASRFSLATVAATSNDRNTIHGTSPWHLMFNRPHCCSNERHQPPGEPVAFDAL
jgi:hypothetical protein